MSVNKDKRETPIWHFFRGSSAIWPGPWARHYFRERYICEPLVAAPGNTNVVVHHVSPQGLGKMEGQNTCGGKMAETWERWMGLGRDGGAAATCEADKVQEIDALQNDGC